MKATELMIGDLVGIEYIEYTKEEFGVVKATKQIMPCKVARISDYIVTLNRQDGKIQDCLYNNLIPIPLTEEILKKNGWFDSEAWSYNHCPEDDKYKLELNLDKRKVWWTINLNEYSIIELNYVHELQHALRLCGVEKDIEL